MTNKRDSLIERYFQTWLQYLAAGPGEFEELRRSAFEAGWTAKETHAVISTPSEPGAGRITCPNCGPQFMEPKGVTFLCNCGTVWKQIDRAKPSEKSEALQPIFTVCGTCQRKATVTSQSEVKLLGILCERTDCPGRPSLRTNEQSC